MRIQRFTQGEVEASPLDRSAAFAKLYDQLGVFRARLMPRTVGQPVVEFPGKSAL